MCDNYKGSGCKWKKYILGNHIPVKKTILRICDDIDETNFWEAFYIDQALENGDYLWNVMKGGSGHDSDRRYTKEEIQERRKAYHTKWREANREQYQEQRRQYYQNNKERIEASKKQYREKHKEKFLEYHRNYYQTNKADLSNRKRQYYYEHKEHIAEHGKAYWRQYKLTHAEYLKAKAKKI